MLTRIHIKVPQDIQGACAVGKGWGKEEKERVCECCVCVVCVVCARLEQQQKQQLGLVCHSILCCCCVCFPKKEGGMDLGTGAVVLIVLWSLVLVATLVAQRTQHPRCVVCVSVCVFLCICVYVDAWAPLSSALSFSLPLSSFPSLFFPAPFPTLPHTNIINC